MRCPRVAVFLCALAFGCGPDSTAVTTGAPDQPTLANAGTDQAVAPGELVMLSAAASTPREGGSLISSLWMQTLGPPVALFESGADTAQFYAPAVATPTTLEFALNVFDSRGASATDTVRVTVQAATAPPPPTFAFPFGASGLAESTTGTAPFTMSMGSTSAGTLITEIAQARASKTRLFLNMTGGAHENYLTLGVFDLAKWRAKMETFNTKMLKDAVAAAVADGTIIGNSVMDEPQVSGTGDGNTWGPAGTMTKARVDALCGEVKAIFPTLPTGVVHRHDLFEPDKNYQLCDFVVSQFSTRIGSVTAFRDGGLAFAQRSHLSILFSMNVLNGGTQDNTTAWGCIGTGGRGTYAPNCRMTATQVKDVGLALAPAGCGMAMWRYDATFFGRTDNKDAFKAIADRVKSLPGKPCVRF